MCSTAWTTSVGTHVFGVLPNALEDGDTLIVFDNDLEVDGLSA
jgi:hypothetical protein